MMAAILAIAIVSAIFHAIALRTILSLSDRVGRHEQLHECCRDFMEASMNYDRQVDRDIGRLEDWFHRNRN